MELPEVPSEPLPEKTPGTFSLCSLQLWLLILLSSTTLLLCCPSQCEGPEAFWCTALLTWAAGLTRVAPANPADPSRHRELRLRSPLSRHLVVAGEEFPRVTSAARVSRSGHAVRLQLPWDTPCGPTVKLHEQLGPWLCASPRWAFLMTPEPIPPCHHNLPLRRTANCCDHGYQCSCCTKRV